MRIFTGISNGVDGTIKALATDLGVITRMH
jgi:hypothetical protein